MNGYAGAADRYDWKLIGKQELYVPYNGERFYDRSVRYGDMVEPRYPRRDLTRYELHRVWVVEATVRSDRRHMQPRRVFYLDEDAWLTLILQRCHAINTEFADPLPFVEIRATAGSIGKWIWRNYTEEEYRARQAHRGSKGGKVMTPAKIEANRKRATKFDEQAMLEAIL